MYVCSIRGNVPWWRQRTRPDFHDTTVLRQCLYFRPDSVRRIRTNMVMVVIKFDFAWTVLVLLPLFETFKTVFHTVRPCRNTLVNSRFSYNLNLLVSKCFFSQSRKYRNEGICIRQDTHSNIARHGGVCSSCHRRCISRFGMSARKRLPVSCIQPSGFFGLIR